jgi:hypothetical protein
MERYLNKTRKRSDIDLTNWQTRWQRVTEKGHYKVYFLEYRAKKLILTNNKNPNDNNTMIKISIKKL